MTSLAQSVAETVSLAELSSDPYPIYAALRRDSPVAFIPALDMWWVTRYEDVHAVLLSSETFVTGTEASLLFDTFGEHMLTSDGTRHRRYRTSQLNGAFMPASLAPLRASIDARVSALFSDSLTAGSIDLRATVASRLPILTMLDLFGLPEAAETLLRGWYDAFEAALSNHARDPGVRMRAHQCVEAFHTFLQAEIETQRASPRAGLLTAFLNRPADEQLSDEEIRRNALIMFFGGISTVEAVTLNMLWALLTHTEAFACVKADRTLLDAAFDESMRWTSPVQSATRHVIADCEIAGVSIPAGATVNCMIASANRDQSVFAKPDIFDIYRQNARKHLGFATGPHLCLGRHLARMEALAVSNYLLDHTRNLRQATPLTVPEGHEFRQPRALWLEWNA